MSETFVGEGYLHAGIKNTAIAIERHGSVVRMPASSGLVSSLIIGLPMDADEDTAGCVQKTQMHVTCVHHMKCFSIAVHDITDPKPALPFPAPPKTFGINRTIGSNGDATTSWELGI